MQTIKINLDKKNISFLAFVTLLSGCSDINSNASLNSSKALAKVNGDEISLNQFNAEINRAHLDNEVDIKVKDQLLTKIIDRQLLVQEASKLNLDRAPEVVEAVNSAKAQIYAQAYLANRISKSSPPTDGDISQYIEAHPETCAHRKVFSTQDIVFNYDRALIDLTSLQSSATDIDSLRAILESRHIKYNLVSSSFSMDTLPSIWADKLKTASVGNLLFTHDSHKVIVKSITNITENPMSADEAKNYAAKVLSEDKKQKFITSEVTRLRKLSTIKILDSEMALANKSHSHTVNPPLTKP
ncbi:MAG: EpsD family peptidyl-prolyl cis-trans isomerase [Methylophilus sp.]|uniref:EpsD family peptidyl-prolyl cis-trans isomerase n=1 Tax=Methylophilus sp. TaxID=29541 RepID=UPI003F9F758C